MAFDLGGGTFDVSIMKKLDDSDENILKVLGISGEGRLGGQDFTNEMIKLFMKKQEKLIEEGDVSDEDDRKDEDTVREKLDMFEKAKIALS